MPQSAAQSLSKPWTYRRSRPPLFSHLRSAFDRDPALGTDRCRAWSPFALLFRTPKTTQCPPITRSAKLALPLSGIPRVHCTGTSSSFFLLLVEGHCNDLMVVIHR